MVFIKKKAEIESGKGETEIWRYRDRVREKQKWGKMGRYLSSPQKALEYWKRKIVTEIVNIMSWGVNLNIY